MTPRNDGESAVAEEDGIYPDMARSMNKAREFLNQGDADAALKSLDAFMSRDFQGVHMAVPEFNKLLLVCQLALGRGLHPGGGKAAQGAGGGGTRTRG